jgi:PTS system glucose-specific IIA component
VTDVGSPVAGEVVGLAGVPDEVFAEAMVGPGTAVDPVGGHRGGPADAVAPVDGVLVKLHPHAYVVVDAAGHGVLVHLGIDTVTMRGEGFALLAAEMDRVTAGQPVVRWDPDAVRATGRSTVCPVVALDASPDALTDVRETGRVDTGERLFSWG